MLVFRQLPAAGRVMERRLDRLETLYRAADAETVPQASWAMWAVVRWRILDGPDDTAEWLGRFRADDALDAVSEREALRRALIRGDPRMPPAHLAALLDLGLVELLIWMQEPMDELAAIAAADDDRNTG